MRFAALRRSRSLWGPLVATLCAIAAMPTAEAQSPRGDKWYFDVEPTSEKTRRWLEAPCELRYESLPLTQVVEDLRRRGAPVHLDKQSLEAEEIASDTPVDFAARELPHGQALDAMLKELDLAFVIDKAGRIVILSMSDAEARLQTRFYDLTGIVAGRDRRTWEFEVVLDLLKTTIAPETWDEVGGPGTAEGLAHAKPYLVVTQRRDVQDEVKRFLETLRANFRDTRTGGRSSATGAMGSPPPLGRSQLPRTWLPSSSPRFGLPRRDVAPAVPTTGGMF